MDHVKDDYVIGLDDLPFEILEKIFQSDSITCVELCKLSETCQKFYSAVNQNKLWEVKFMTQWPKLAKVYASSSANHANKVVWKQECIARRGFSKIVKQKLTEMSEKLYGYDSSVRYICMYFRGLLQRHEMAAHFLVDELEFLIFNDCSDRNLTDKYYGLKLLRFARQHCVFPLLKTFLNQSEDYQAPEIGASLIAQYCQPNTLVSVGDISRALDDIALYVKENIIPFDEQHPVLSASIIPPSNPLKKSLWTPRQCEIILNCINITLFHSLQYRVIFFDVPRDTTVYIDKVLVNKCGLPVTVMIIYMAIAHRLGVKLFPVSFDETTCVVKWLQHPDLGDDNLRYSYVDLYNKGKVLTSLDCFQNDLGSVPLHSVLRAKTSTEIMISVCRHLTEISNGHDTVEDDLIDKSTALELYSLFEPISFRHKSSLVQIYIQLKFKLHEAHRIVRQIKNYNSTVYGVQPLVTYVEGLVTYRYPDSEDYDIPQAKMRVKCRSEYPQVLFAVGMVMKHKRYNYSCVINGWDPECRADEIWIARMGVRKLLRKDNQPFYNVLVDDGTCRYAAEENLEPAQFPCPISHCKVGKYFQEFHIDHYVPNKQMEQEYPEDISARDEILRKIAFTPVYMAGSSY